MSDRALETADAQAAFWLRRLCFPKELEHEFRIDYARRSSGYVRVGAALIACVVVLGLIGSLARNEFDAAQVHSLAVKLPLLLVLSIFTRSRYYETHMQAAVVGLAFLWRLSLTLFFWLLPPAAPLSEPAYFREIASVCTAVIMAYGLVRLRLIPAVSFVWSSLLLDALEGLYLFRLPVDWVVRGTAYLLMANLAGMAIAYLMEHSARRDFLLTRLLEAEREKSERLLLNILPESVAQRLKSGPGTVADSFAGVTVLFADLVDFTPLSARLSAEEVVALLNRVFSEFDRLAEEHGLEKIKTIGDAYMVVGGLPEPREDHTGAVAEMALDMSAALAALGAATGLPLRMRIGINTGPVVAGVIGTRKFIYDLWGDTVNMASRMESHGLPGEIQVTGEVYRRLRDRYRFEERPLAAVKGRGEMTAYLLKGRRGVPPAPPSDGTGASAAG